MGDELAMFPAFPRNYPRHGPLADAKLVCHRELRDPACCISFAYLDNLILGQLGLRMLAASHVCPSSSADIFFMCHPLKIVNMVIAWIAVEMIADKAGRSRPDERTQNQIVNRNVTPSTNAAAQDNMEITSFGAIEAAGPHDACATVIENPDPPEVTDLVAAFVAYHCFPMFGMICASHVVASLLGDDSVRAARRSHRSAARSTVQRFSERGN